MGTISDKLTYLNDTKGLLKQKINNLGGDITDQTTFRQYADKLQTIYENAPKTDYEEGSNITLSNCLKGKLDFEDDKVVYGDTTQESTQGYNLLNSAGGSIAYKPEGTITIDSNGVINASANMGYTSINIPSITLKAGTTYTFERSFTGSYNSLLVDTNGNNVMGIGYNKTSVTATIESDVTINKLNGALLSGDNYFWLYEGSTQKPFEKYTNGPAPNPSYPFPINTVTGEQEVTIRGTNLFSSELEQGGLTAEGLNVASTIRLRSKDYIIVKPNTTYIIKAKNNTNKTMHISVSYYTTNDFTTSRIGFENWATIPLTFTTPASCNYIRVLFLFTDGSDITAQNVTEPQLNKGTTLLDYEPYITPITKTLSLGNLELAEIGTYRDELFTDRSTGKWYKHSAIDKLIINSNLSANRYTSIPGMDVYRITNFDAPNVERPIMSSAFKGIIPVYGPNSDITNREINSLFINYVISKIDICTEQNAYSSASDFLTQLNGTTIYLAKTTATDTEITDTSLKEQLEEIYNIMSLNGTTIIEIAGTLPMIMKVRALKND